MKMKIFDEDIKQLELLPSDGDYIKSISHFGKLYGNIYGSWIRTNFMAWCYTIDIYLTGMKTCVHQMTHTGMFIIAAYNLVWANCGMFT